MDKYKIKTAQLKNISIAYYKLFLSVLLYLYFYFQLLSVLYNDLSLAIF